MTKEQWLIYLYGIYPEGGWIALWIMLLISYIMFLLYLFTAYDIEGHDLWLKISNKLKIIPIVILSLLIFLSNLIPNKNTFLAVVTTPTVIKYVKYVFNKNRLKKIDKLFDKTLDKMLKDK